MSNGILGNRMIFSSAANLGSGALFAFTSTILLDWYVDSVNGNDANSGKSTGAAFKTIAKLLTVLAAGQSVGLARDSHWHEELNIGGATYDGVEIEAYGTGANPVLDCSDVAPNAGFSLTGGTTNVYQATVNIDGAVGLTWVSAWENDVRLLRATSVANCDATAGSYYPSSDTTTGAITLYVHATDNSDVSANGKIYEYSHRQVGLYTGGTTNAVIRGITTRRNLHTGGSMFVGYYCKAYDCRCEDGNKHNLTVMAGSYCENVVASEAYYTATASMFIYNNNTPAGEPVTLINCTAQLAVYNANIGAFYGHSNLGGTFGTVTYSGCMAVNCVTGFEIGDNTADTQLVNCTTTNCPFSVKNSVAGASYTLSGHTVTGTGYVLQNLAAATITIDGCTATLTNAASGMFYSSAVVTLSLTNSTLALTNSGAVIRLTAAAAGSTLTLNNNRYTDFTTYFYQLECATTYTSDYNYFHPGTTDVRINATTYTTVALYQTGTGQDAHSTIG